MEIWSSVNVISKNVKSTACEYTARVIEEFASVFSSETVCDVAVTSTSTRPLLKWSSNTAPVSTEYVSSAALPIKPKGRDTVARAITRPCVNFLKIFFIIYPP